MMDHYQRIVHIDFCFKAPEGLVIGSNRKEGYWYITEIRGTYGTVWRKSVIGEWNRIMHKSILVDGDEVAIKNGKLKKSIHNITAADSIHKELDDMLLQHMKNEKKTEYPYNYWQKKDWEKDDYGYYDLPED